ncbi:MAG TPA: hypothetical protein VF260_06290 [Bacilli bacterium]
MKKHLLLLLVLLNDPLSGKKAVKADRRQFIRSWQALGKQA